ncbi:glycosyltransferase [Mycobacterium sp. B14F4]|uniref:glycosyltransferase n=1 Tax=Mycobacterium sp. B14F4 TaxID=3153565 RepID=UPI00325C5AB5
MGADEKDEAVRDANVCCPRIRLSIVVSRLCPVTGLESVTLSLIEEVASTYDVKVIVLADETSTIIQNPSVVVESWGSKVVRWKRILTIWRAIRHRNDLYGSVIILSGAWAAIPMLFALPKRSRKNTIVWEHSLDRHQVTINKRLALLRAIARPLYGRARATVAVSESLRRDMYDAGFRGTIEVIPNIVRKFESDQSLEVIPGTLLAVGSLSKVKNQSLALRTLALLPENYSLDIVGDGPERNNLIQLALELGIADRVRFHGYVQNPAEHFARAQILVHTSHSETYGLVMYEAADFKKPVIAANQGVMAEVVPRLVPGVLARPEPHSFASAILSLEVNPITEEDFVEAAGRRELLSQHVVRDWKRLISSAAGE